MSEAREEANRRWPEGWGSAIGDGTWRDGVINGFILGAEWARAEWEAEQGETEWEYGEKSPNSHYVWGPWPAEKAESLGIPSDLLVRRRKPGPWLPVTDRENESAAR